MDPESSEPREKTPSEIVTDEDSIREQIIQLYGSRSGYAGNVTRKLHEFQERVSEGASLENIAKALESLNEAYNKLENVHLEFINLAASHDKDRLETSQKQFAIATQNVHAAREHYESLLQYQSADVHVSPVDSVSNVSHNTKSSSASSALAKAAAKRAKLEAQVDFLRKQSEIESEKFQLEQNLKHLKLQADIEAASAEEKVLSEYVLEKSNGSNASLVKPKVTEIKHELVSDPPAAKQVDHSKVNTYKHMSDKPYVMPQPHVHSTASGMNPFGTNYHSNIETRQFRHSMLNPNAHEWISKSDQPTQHDTALNEHAQYSVNTNMGSAGITQKDSESEYKLQRQLLDVISLPKTSLMTFDGNPLDYWVFMNAFDSSVGQSSVSDGVKLNRLLEYCTGKAAQVVKPCIMMNASKGYLHARKLLKERFGNNYMISEAWIKKITEGTSIRPNNAQAIRDLADDVTACMEALRAMDMLAEIDSRCRMVKIVSRLPFYLQGRWRKEALQSVTNTGKYPNIARFSAFLETVAKELLDPVFGLNVEQNEPKEVKGGKFKQFKRGGSSFTVQSSSVEKFRDRSTRNIDSSRKALPKCFVCNGNHQMVNCKDFLGMTAEKRLDIAREMKLCFNCLEFRNHSAKLCRQKSNCDFENCQMKHSRLLHEAFKSDNKDRQKMTNELKLQGHVTNVTAQSNACTKSVTDFKKVSLPIVTLHVRGKGENDFVRTNALLDPGSNKTFCSAELVKLLGLKGKRTALTLKTLNNGKDAIAEEVCLEAMSIIGKRKHRKLVELPKVYALEEFPTLQGSIVSVDDISKWNHMRNVSVPQEQNVTILIGQDVPQGLLPLEVRHGNDGEPYAIRTALGWTVNGPLGEISGTLEDVSSSHFVYGKPESDRNLERQVERFWTLDTGQVLAGSVPQMSVDDKRVIGVWNDSVTHKEGHYELCIPFKPNGPNLPDNRSLALKRLQHLSKRFQKDPMLHERYTQEIDKLLEMGYAERVPDQLEKTETEIEGKIWYLPHHAVFNPNKPDKLRVVFDCAANYLGASLNESVSQGPDLTNKLLGVLLRFREGSVALMADIEAMFYQVKVSSEDRDVLRFLWWKDGDMKQEPTTYRMTVHPFGGVWSPSCANFALKCTIEDNGDSYDSETVNTALRNFYVDDCLKSLNNEEQAVKLVREIRQLTSLGGFRLTKWISNSRNVLDSIPLEERAKEVRELELHCGALPVERALGVRWNIESDMFGIKVTEKETNFTRRSVLSVTSSVYDPLGIVSPFVLQAKKIFQSECKSNKGWDDELDNENKRAWSKWLSGLMKLKGFEIPRCVIPANFGSLLKVELHHFCDASQEAYGSVSYIRVMNENQSIHCGFLLGKSRLAPIQQMSIPRLELSAAVLAVRMSSVLNEELSFEVQKNVYWTDSMVVLQYIKNKTKRFHTFVANRVAIIHDGSSAESWRYVDSKSNPADDASRGLNVDEMISKDRWKQGPEFLWKHESEWPKSPDCPELSKDDKEIRSSARSHAVETKAAEDPIGKLVVHYSSWHRLKKAVAWVLKFKDWMRNRNVLKEICTEDLRNSEIAIVRYLQGQFYQQELRDLSCGHKNVSTKSNIYSLEPILGSDGVLRGSGRLLSAPIPECSKYPIILPRDHHVTKLIVRHVHEFVTRHSGREFVLANIRQTYWIPRCRSLINGILRNCVVCQRLRAVSGSQKMASLPADRVQPENAPFTSVGIDCFGPFYVKRGRSQEKRYGCIFTCLSMRAIHIEKLHSLDSDSFISALIRFIARRGIPELIRSDNGTNFVGGEKELKASIKQCTEHRTTKEYLLLQNIKWEFNPPSASHMGGVWERQIRSVRKVLNVILRDQVLDDERLDTVFCEAESIVNSRPLTYVSDNPKDCEPLTPNHLLLLRSNQAVPLGKFKHGDRYGRRWRHAQYLADMFWERWILEYLPTLQFRRKWRIERENFKEGDIVLVMDESTPRMNWPLGRVTEVYLGKDGLVRSVKLQTKSAVLVRPIHKLCYLEGVL